MFSDGGALSAFAWTNERRGWLRFVLLVPFVADLGSVCAF